MELFILMIVLHCLMLSLLGDKGWIVIIELLFWMCVFAMQLIVNA